jgi:dTDP-4-amino-4,6-dideoxygalactose transaminase
MRSLTTFDGSADAQGLGRLVPRPDIPVQPILSWGAFGLPGSQSGAPAVIDQGRVAFVTAGRIAIAHALALAGVGPGQKVLVPAYHCIVMIEPIVQRGAQPVFYALREDLSVDLDDVAKKLDRETRAFIAVNYFGFPQDLDGLRRFCDRNGLCFIEDCAHSFFGAQDGRPLGSFGHLAVASLVKFFPVRDGGCLIVGKDMENRESVALRSQNLAASARLAFNLVEEAVGYGRLAGLRPVIAGAQRARQVSRSAAPATRQMRDNPALERSGQTGGFDPAWIGIRATAASRLLCRAVSRRRIVERRRRNYARLAREFSTIDGCRPVFPTLRDGVVPYMFPLWVDRLPEIFPGLEDRAVPMQRFGQFLWPQMNPDICPVTARHSRHCVQLACHQDLDDDEITTIIERVRDAAA